MRDLQFSLHYGSVIIEVGDYVVYRPDHGPNTRDVRVIALSQELTPGRPGFAGRVPDGPEKNETFWGYMDQIVRVYRGYYRFFHK